jgi:Trypsin-like peptidase domain
VTGGGRRLALLCAPTVLAASAVAHATGGDVSTAPALVRVGERGANVATGFTVSPGRVVTVAHAVEGDSVTVRGTDGIARRAAVVRRDETLDLALLAMPGQRPPPGFTPAGPRLLVLRGGEPAALPVRVVREIAANVRTAGQTDVARRPALELAGAVAAGDSGAPVLRDGHIAGVVFARSRDRPGVAYAVDAEALARLIG